MLTNCAPLIWLAILSAAKVQRGETFRTWWSSGFPIRCVAPVSRRTKPVAAVGTHSVSLGPGVGLHISVFPPDACVIPLPPTGGAESNGSYWTNPSDFPLCGPRSTVGQSAALTVCVATALVCPPRHPVSWSGGGFCVCWSPPCSVIRMPIGCLHLRDMARWRAPRKTAAGGLSVEPAGALREVNRSAVSHVSPRLEEERFWCQGTKKRSSSSRGETKAGSGFLHASSKKAGLSSRPSCCPIGLFGFGSLTLAYARLRAIDMLVSLSVFSTLVAMVVICEIEFWIDWISAINWTLVES